nr:hypothetical protein [Tanacetum cinerariifolium]
MANDEEDHALVADEEAPTKFALMANTNTENKVFDNSLCSKDYKKNNDSLNSRINLRRTSVTGFPAQSISSSNTIALDSPNLLVLNTEASQSRQHGKK